MSCIVSERNPQGFLYCSRENRVWKSQRETMTYCLVILLSGVGDWLNERNLNVGWLYDGRLAHIGKNDNTSYDNIIG